MPTVTARLGPQALARFLARVRMPH